MKRLLLLFITIILLFSTSQAQFMPGQFYNNVGYYTPATTSSCILDSTFYTIRYGGVQSLSVATDSIHYFFERFYGLQAIRRGPASSLIVLKAGLVYRYFPATDSFISISAGLPAATVTDIDAVDSVIWAIVDFNEIGRYTDNTGWQIITLGNSYGPSRILSQSDSSVYLADNLTVRLYSPSGTSAPLYSFISSGSLSSWCVDSSRNAWIVADQSLMKVTSIGVGITFNNSNTSLSSGEDITTVATAPQGLVWGLTNYGNLYQFGASYAPQILNSYIATIASDPTTQSLYMIIGDSIRVLNGSVTHSYSFGYMPYEKIQAISTNNIATDKGIFTYQTYNQFIPTNFKDTSSAPYANDVTCFTVDINQVADSGYGTHHGVFQTSYPINNAQLPDTNINYLYLMNGSYYIGTDKGLCIFNQVVYTTYDTSNSPLPSNKVTYIVSYLSPYTNAQELWIGTDHGIALYSNGQWSRYDKSVVHIPSFSVSGILPCPLYYAAPDTSVWITTLGSGLVKLKRDSSYTVLNTSNGGFQDDSLYYVTQYAGCEYYGTVLIGTSTHGIAYLELPQNIFEYTVSGSDYYTNTTVPIHSSEFFSNPYSQYQYQYYPSNIIMVTDAGFFYISPCIGEGIKIVSRSSMPVWHQIDDDRMWIQLPADYMGVSNIELYDIQGRKLISSLQSEDSDDRIYLDITGMATGAYILHMSHEGNQNQVKVIISK